MSDVLNRLNRLSRYVGMAAMAFMILLGVAIVAVVILTIAVTLNPDIMSWFDDAATSGQFLSICAILVVAGSLGIATLYYVYRFFMNIHRDNTPFTDENVKCLQRITILILISVIATPVISMIMGAAFEPESGNMMDFNLLSLFAAFLMYLLSLVFKYGTALQKESDETL